MPMPPYHTSTTALFDSTERLNSIANQNEPYHNGSGHKVPLDTSQDWDGYLKAYSRDRDSGLVSIPPPPTSALSLHPWNIKHNSEM